MNLEINEIKEKPKSKKFEAIKNVLTAFGLLFTLLTPITIAQIGPTNKAIDKYKVEISSAEKELKETKSKISELEPKKNDLEKKTHGADILSENESLKSNLNKLKNTKGD